MTLVLDGSGSTSFVPAARDLIRTAAPLLSLAGMYAAQFAAGISFGTAALMVGGTALAVGGVAYAVNPEFREGVNTQFRSLATIVTERTGQNPKANVLTTPSKAPINIPTTTAPHTNDDIERLKKESRVFTNPANSGVKPLTRTGSYEDFNLPRTSGGFKLTEPTIYVLASLQDAQRELSRIRGEIGSVQGKINLSNASLNAIAQRRLELTNKGKHTSAEIIELSTLNRQQSANDRTQNTYRDQIGLLNEQEQVAKTWVAFEEAINAVVQSYTDKGKPLDTTRVENLRKIAEAFRTNNYSLNQAAHSQGVKKEVRKILEGVKNADGKSGINNAQLASLLDGLVGPRNSNVIRNVLIGTGAGAVVLAGVTAYTFLNGKGADGSTPPPSSDVVIDPITKKQKEIQPIATGEKVEAPLNCAAGASETAINLSDSVKKSKKKNKVTTAEAIREATKTYGSNTGVKPCL